MLLFLLPLVYSLGNLNSYCEESNCTLIFSSKKDQLLHTLNFKHEGPIQVTSNETHSCSMGYCWLWDGGNSLRFQNPSGKEEIIDVSRQLTSNPNPNMDYEVFAKFLKHMKLLEEFSKNAQKFGINGTNIFNQTLNVSAQAGFAMSNFPAPFFILILFIIATIK